MSLSSDHLPKNKRMRPGVKALIIHDGKFLVISENVKSHGENVVIHDFPGGGIEFGENIKDALIREVKEEIGLDIKVGKIVGAWGFVLGEKEHENLEKDGTHIICIGYQCEVIGELKIDLSNNPAQEDIFNYEWFTKNEILSKEVGFIRHQDMLEAIKNLDI